MIIYSFLKDSKRLAKSLKTSASNKMTAITTAITSMDPSPYMRLFVPNLSIPVSSTIGEFLVKLSPESHSYGMNSSSARALSSLKKMRVCTGKLMSHICMNIRN